MSGIGQYRDMVSDQAVGYMPYPTMGVRSLRSLHPSWGYRETASPRQVSGFDIRYLLLPKIAGPASLPYLEGWVQMSDGRASERLFLINPAMDGVSVSWLWPWWGEDK